MSIFAMLSYILIRMEATAATTELPKLTNASVARQLFSIDALRGLAAVAVMMTHANGFFWRGGKGIPLTSLLFGYGFLGVSLFFVISGFCIHLPYAASNKPLGIKTFAVRRLFRIYPPYLVVVIVCTLLMKAQSRLTGVPNDATVLNFFGHLFLWHYFIPISSPSTGLSPVFWSITIEVYFYILYVITLPVLRRVGIGRCTIAALAIGIAYRLLWETYATSANGTMLALLPHRFAGARFGEWLLGAWIAETYASPRKSQANRHFAGPLTLAAGLISLIGMILLSWHGQYLPRDWLDLTSTFSFAIIVVALVGMEQARPSPKNFPVLRSVVKWLGDRSYSLYLVHFTAIASVGLAYALAFHVNSRNSMQGTAAWGLVTIAGIVASLFCTAAMYRFVERPSHRLARTLATALEPRISPPAVSVTSGSRHLNLRV